MSYKASPDRFEMWLLGRVAEAVEAGEVSGNLLVELREELGVTRSHHPAFGHATAIRSLVDLLAVDRAAHQEVMREELLREVAESWLADQRKVYLRHWSPVRS
jgi:hypothetical protein